jgi:hypothetical protein
MVNGALVLCGSLLGAYMTEHVPASISLAGFEWTPRSSLLFIFLLSGLVRVGASLLLLPRFREVRPVDPIPHSQLIFRITHLSSLAGGATFSILPFVRRRKRSKIERGAQKRGQGDGES